MPVNEMDLGKKLVELRKERKFSQEDLAEVFNVTRTTISNWELGITSPDIEQATKIAKYFNVSLDYLVGIDSRDIPVDKVSNTETLAGLILKLLKRGIVFIVIFLVFIIAIILGRVISESSLSNSRIIYYELNGEIFKVGGDAYLMNMQNKIMDIVNLVLYIKMIKLKKMAFFQNLTLK